MCPRLNRERLWHCTEIGTPVACEDLHLTAGIYELVVHRVVFDLMGTTGFPQDSWGRAKCKCMKAEHKYCDPWKKRHCVCLLLMVLTSVPVETSVFWKRYLRTMRVHTVVSSRVKSALFSGAIRFILARRLKRHRGAHAPSAEIVPNAN